MQSHGIANFPEPDSGGKLNLTKGQPLPDPNSPQFQAAAKACVSLNMAGVAPDPAQAAQRLATAVTYAQCMRSHGVTNFPDPSSDGSFDLQGTDVNSSQIRSADKACASDTVGIDHQGGRT